MSDWDDMVERGHGNSDGTLTDSFYESCESSIEEDDINLEYEYINIDLTPAKYLSPDEKYIRLKIENNKEFVSWEKFELMHDRSNGADRLAIGVYFNQFFIGYIVKNNTFESSININDFFFNNNQLRKIEINFFNNEFQARRELTYEIKKAKAHKKKIAQDNQIKLEKQKIEIEKQRLQDNKEAKIESENKKTRAHIEGLYYSADIGIIFKDTFTISIEGIVWKDKQYNLESITRVAYGVIYNKNYNIAGTKYGITIGDKKSYIQIETKRKKVYSTIIDRISKTVEINIMNTMINNLKKGRCLTFDSTSIWNTGITLENSSWFFSDKKKFTWQEISIWSDEGDFIIEATKNKKYSVHLSYLRLYNVNFLEKLIRGLKNSNVAILSEVKLSTDFTELVKFHRKDAVSYAISARSALAAANKATALVDSKAYRVSSTKYNVESRSILAKARAEAKANATK